MAAVEGERVVQHVFGPVVAGKGPHRTGAASGERRSNEQSDGAIFEANRKIEAQILDPIDGEREFIDARSEPQLFILFGPPHDRTALKPSFQRVIV